MISEIQKVRQNDWTILSLVDWSTSHLVKKGFEDARLNVELLLCHLLKCKRIDLYLRFDQILTQDELESFKKIFKRRLDHEPLQYIVGVTEFMGFLLKVDSRVFIPRPETEVLVEQVINWMNYISSYDLKVFDIGTGSGNIAISIAKNIEHSTIDAIDISSDALEVALDNVRSHHVEDRVSLHQIDFLTPQQKYPHSSYNVLVSNPPYISKIEFDELQPEIRDYEPTFANTDNSDGLTFFRNIAIRGRQLLNSGGVIFVEIAYNQNLSVLKIFKENNYSNIDVISDYNGIKRVVKAVV